MFNERNEPILVGTKSLVNGWILGIAVNEDEITSGLDYIILLLAGMMVIAMMLTIVFSSLIAKMLSRPITYIAQKIDKVGQGNYEISIEDAYCNRKDEVGILSRSLKIMVERQNTSFNEIKEYSEDLEKKS